MIMFSSMRVLLTILKRKTKNFGITPKTERSSLNKQSATNANNPILTPTRRGLPNQEFWHRYVTLHSQNRTFIIKQTIRYQRKRIEVYLSPQLCYEYTIENTISNRIPIRDAGFKVHKPRNSSRGNFERNGIKGILSSCGTLFISPGRNVILHSMVRHRGLSNPSVVV